jgi:uncharacterized protein YhaN
MRFLELHLDRFGCFTDRRLTFRTDAALTVIYGANEAGKSTALAAIADVLYGIEARSPFDFLHRYQDMRLGAAILGEDSRRFDFRRRKGNQNTLLDSDEAPLAEDALASFLGNVDRALFLDAFGLNRERLRAGARRLIDGGGRVGETLLAAAPGLSSLIALRGNLAAEAEELFPAGRKVSSRPFWQASERHAEARKRVRQESLHAETVRAAQAGRNKAAEAVDLLEQEQHKVRKELSRLGRLRNALPRLRRIDELEAARTGLGSLPEVAADFPVRCRRALEARRTLAQDRQRLDQDIADVRTPLEALSVDDTLLAHAEAVDRLDKRHAEVAKAAADRSKLEGALDKVRANLDEHARRLGMPDRDVLLSCRPADATLARLRSLVAQRRRLRDQRDERGKSLYKVVAELDDLTRQRQALGHVADPAPLRGQLVEFADLTGRFERREELKRTLEGRQGDLDDRLRRLVVPVASADALAHLAVPDLASVDWAIERFDSIEKRRSELDSERQRLTSEAASVERRIGDLKADGDVPTADALATARRERDDLWQDLRPRLLGAPGPVAQATDVAAYEDAVARADNLADRRQAEADRIAEDRTLRAEQGEIQASLAANAQALAEVESQGKKAQAEWTELWSPAQLTPTTPREMRAWLQAAADILRLRSELGGEQSRYDEIDAKLSDMTDRLNKLAKGLRIEASGPVDLLTAAAAAVSAMETTFHNARLLSQDLVRCEKANQDLEDELGKLGRQEVELLREWSEVAAAIGLREEALEEEAEAALTVWQAVPALEISLNDLEHRIETIQRDWQAFEKATEELLLTVASDLRDTAPVAASAALCQRLIEARQGVTRRDGYRATLAALRDKANKRHRHEELNEAELAELCRAAGVGDCDALEALAGRIEQGSQLASQLADERKALLDAADGLGEPELRAELAGRDPDALSARLQELGDAQSRLEVTVREAITAQARAQSDLERIEAQAGAAAAAQDEQMALAEIADIIEAWTGVVAAERLLSAAIEAYRAQHQNPLLDRASEAFAIATGGAFSGISLDYDDADSHRIVAVRPGGARLAIDKLSEGTADQLFLALRIATIEDHARRARPLPFIADDLFVTFDDTRTKAGLALLADLGRTTQAIVFTHHQHVVEAARHALGPAVDTIDLG